MEGSMFISKLNIQNYRCFADFTVCFNEGVNVLIGHNSTGKSNILKALSLIFDLNTTKRLNINDFNKHMTLKELKESPPEISITATISQGKGDIISNDLATVRFWLTKLEEPYEAQLTYKFFLPEAEHEHYIKMLSDVSDEATAWKLINGEFIKLYTHNLWGGDPANRRSADRESLQKFDYQFLDAIRDVERDMFTGRNTLLKNILDFFLDYDIKTKQDQAKEDTFAELKDRREAFAKEADILLESLQQRLSPGKEKILSYASDIGALFEQSEPDFEGSMTEEDLFSALQLIIRYGEHIRIPISHNGLGYNNLIYISLLLSKMQIDSDGEYLGSNAKVFPILALEEPEAHLHPTMQYQFLSFLTKNMKQNKVRQVFITTHSTHIVASVPLDNIVCLYKEGNKVSVAYPASAFDDESSKSYVERFLDATKSDMLFAERVILVEGITEQLLLSILAKYMGDKYSLEANRVTVINIGGTNFKHFLSIFDSNKPNTIKRKVACITDVDPLRRKKDSPNSRFKECYPFEYGVNTTKYEYKQNENIGAYDGHPNIRVFHSDLTYGKTFEYDLVLSNPGNELLLTDSISNTKEIQELMQAYCEGRSLEEMLGILRNTKENTRIKDAMEHCSEKWREDDKKSAVLASRYQNSVNKGANALELAYRLQSNLAKKVISKENLGDTSRESSKYQELIVPPHIQEAIKWVCK